MNANETLTPLVLLVDGKESSATSVEEILKPRGHVVLRAHTGKQALGLVQKVSPDAVLIEAQLSDADGIDLLRELNRVGTIYPTTPKFILSGTELGKAERIEAMSAGAWDVLIRPIDQDELILRLDTFVRAKQAADRVREEGLTDPNTGFYNIRGILRRTKEIRADAFRYERPLTCMAFGPHPLDAPTLPDEEAAELAEIMSQPVAEALRTVTRISDTVGRLGPGEFVVLAPGTDEAGALRLADRVLKALEADSARQAFGITPEALAQLRAGFVSVNAKDETAAEDLLLQATIALRKAQSDSGGFRVRAYDA